MCLDCARAPLSVLLRHADIPLLANTPPYLPVQATQAWAQCVWCEKWRRVPAALAREIGEDQKWTCAQNPRSAFASCDAPEERMRENETWDEAA